MIYRHVVAFKNIFVTLMLVCFAATFLYSVDGIAPNRPLLDDLARNKIIEAQIAYEEKYFGRAFKLVELAKAQRRQESEWAEHTLEEALRQTAVLEIGLDIQVLLNFFMERKNNDVVYIIEDALNIYSVEDFDYSIENVLEYLTQATAFPEADFLLGKLYMIEGELEISDLFFTDAYENRQFLDIPDVQYDILYSMADLYKLQDKKNNYEEVLMLIASEDEKYYTAGAPSQFLTAVLAAIENGMDVDKFFLLYRNDYYKAIKAWSHLTEYFADLNLEDRALETVVLFALATLTRIDEVLTNRDMHYSYTTLQELFKKLKSFSDIAEWASANKVWEGFYVLAELCEKKGFTSFAQEIYTALAEECPERNWQILAQNALN